MLRKRYLLISFVNFFSRTYQFANASIATLVATTLDRVKSVWTGLKTPKPYLLGEFGTSDGIPNNRNAKINDFLERNRTSNRFFLSIFLCLFLEEYGYLTPQETASVDAATWLYLFTHNYNGGIRWKLNDYPYPMNVVTNPLKGDDTTFTGHLNQEREAYFGSYYFDGTDIGKPKPVAFWTKFFGFYLNKMGTNIGENLGNFFCVILNLPTI